ncbi:hypothetical protein NKH18_20495 [Streptomyces sp. M10(2022)]
MNQVVLDLALAWTGPAVELNLQGTAGSSRLLGLGVPAATLHADAIAFTRHLSGRPHGPPDPGRHPEAQAALTAARVVF